MGEPLVSAVIITYNQEQYIKQTIECALAQKVDFDYEIVIGEDCSTDRTREICLHYQEKYPDIIRVITSDKNVGLLDNWYRSVKSAKGKYIAVCAGDDFWHDTDKTQKQVSFLENNPKYGMVHSDADILKVDEGRLIKNFHKSFKVIYDNNSDDILTLLFTGRYSVVACTSVFRKEYFDSYFNINELKKNGILMEDMPLWIIIAAHSKIFYMPESLIVHREMRGTITNPYSFEKKIQIWESAHKCFIYFFKQYKAKFLDSNVNIKTIDQIFNRILLKRAMQANRKDLVQVYYNNIVTQSGQSYLTTSDKIKYYFSHLPFGTRAYNSLLSFFFYIKELSGGMPTR